MSRVKALKKAGKELIDKANLEMGLKVTKPGPATTKRVTKRGRNVNVAAGATAAGATTAAATRGTKKQQDKKKDSVNYNVGVSKGGVPFKEAFRHFRNKGAKTFTWNGKKYTTELAKKMGGGMMKAKGMAKGGAMKKKGYAMGGAAMKKKGYKKGGAAGKFPDLTGDGKVTQKDILRGRGVPGIKKGGAMTKKGMAKGGAMKKKGYAKGGMTKKGYAKGGMTKKGYAKGGPAMKSKGASKGGVRRGKPRGVGAALRGYGKALR